VNHLYSEADLRSLNGQLRRRFILLGLIVAALLAAAVFAWIRRIEWLCIAALILACFSAIFGLDMFCLPLVRYRRLLTAALRARNHTETFVFSRVEPDASMVDGISCRSVIVLGEPDKHGAREQRFYWDARRPLPELAPDAPVTLTYTGRFVTGWEA